MNYAVMEERIKNIDNKVDSIDSKLNKILEKPSKRWDIIIATLISSGVAFALAQIIK